MLPRHPAKTRALLATFTCLLSASCSDGDDTNSGELATVPSDSQPMPDPSGAGSTPDGLPSVSATPPGGSPSGSAPTPVPMPSVNTGPAPTAGSTTPAPGATGSAAPTTDPTGATAAPEMSSAAPTGTESAAGGAPNVPDEPPEGPGGSPPVEPPGAGGDAGAGGDPEPEPTPTVTCPDMVLQPGNSTRNINAGGNSREFVLNVPDAYDGQSPVPLIIDFHGLTGNGPGQRQSSPYPQAVGGEGVIMAFPTGMAGPSGNAWNVGPCCVDGTDDVEFARALVEDVASVACIDPKRVYAVGFSMGGGMSHYLACHAADVFAAVAPAAFDLAEENQGSCDPARPISVMSFRGTNDPIVPYDGGYSAVVPGHPITFLGAEDTLTKWGEINGCSGAPEDMGDNCKGFSSCDAGVEVVLCTRQGGGHEAGNAGIAWPFLKRHAMP